MCIYKKNLNKTATLTRMYYFYHRRDWLSSAWHAGVYLHGAWRHRHTDSWLAGRAERKCVWRVSWAAKQNKTSCDWWVPKRGGPCQWFPSNIDGHQLLPKTTSPLLGSPRADFLAVLRARLQSSRVYVCCYVTRTARLLLLGLGLPLWLCSSPAAPLRPTCPVSNPATHTRFIVGRCCTCRIFWPGCSL